MKTPHLLLLAGRSVESVFFSRKGVASSVGAFLAYGLCLPLAAQVTDSDGDSLPDDWETQYFGNLTQNAAGDFDADTVPNGLEFSSNRNPTLAETVAGVPDWQGVPGALRMERWNGISGSTVANLTAAAAFPQSASSRGFVTSANAGVNVGDNIGVRWRGTLTAPVAGQYKFHVAADDAAHVYLSPTASCFSKSLICRVDSWVGVGNYTASSVQSSGLITLAAGQTCYIEVLMKEGGGGDHLSMAWTLPGATAPVVIPGRLADGTVVLTSEVPDPLDVDDDGLPDAWESAQGLNPASAADHGWKDSDGDGFSNLAEFQTSGSALTVGGNVGYLEWHTFWLSSHNNSLAALTQSAAFAQVPSGKGYFLQSEADQNAGTNFGRRIRGVVTIPTTGTYYFWIAGDDACALLLNPAGESRFGKSIVAYSNAATAYRAFTTKASQKSQGFALTAGQKVYVEALYVEGGGADHCSIAWSGPPSASPVLIPSAQLSLCANESLTVNGVVVNNDADNDSIPDQWEAAVGLAVTNAGAAASVNGEYGDPDGDGLSNFLEYQNNSNPLTANGIAGKWAHEFYADIAGGRVVDLLGNAGILGGADLFRLSESTEHFRNRFDNCGERFRATVMAPATGTYTFWIAGDDGAELWLSSDDRKFNKRKIALVDDVTADYTFSSYRQWDKAPGQMSAPLALVAGQQYFIEVMHKESGGDDHVTVAWSYNTQNWATPLLGAVATQSSTGYGGVASRVIDGNTNGAWAANSLTHTNSVANSWLQVDLGTTRPINRVVLFNRTDAGTQSRLSNFRISLQDLAGVEIAGQNFYTSSGTFAPASMTWDVPTAVEARKVVVKLLGNNNAGNGFLSLAELQAFQLDGQSASRVVLPAAQVTSFVRDADDLDDDYLPDTWETSMGLSAADNGFSNEGNGEYGDPDADSLVNRDEWLLGTHPLQADTDGDGYGDGQEVFFLGTNPLVPELANPTVVGDVALQAIANASATWIPTPEGGVFSMETRGWIDYPITITTAGYYLYEIRGRARGANIRAREDFLLDVLISGKKVATSTLTSLNGTQGMAGGFAGWLSAGTHTLRIWNHNLLARRTLQLDSLKIVKPSGADLDADGLPDWIAQFLNDRNGSTWSGTGSFTSPVCLEGFARNLEASTLSVNNGSTSALQRGIDNKWFADAPLDASLSATPMSLSFENGLLQENYAVEWTPYNVSAMSEITIRKGDSMRLTAYPPGGSASTENVTYTLNGSNIGSQAANQPMPYAFTAAGIHTLIATYTSSQGSVSSTSIIEVLSADFGPVMPVYMNRSRLWTLPSVPAALPIEKDKSLSLARQSVASGSAFTIDTNKMGTNTVLTRTSAQGPVLARGQVEGILLSHTSNYEIPVIQTLANGDRIVELTVMATQLPPGGGYVRLEIWLGGRLFLDGSTQKNLYAADFDENGIAKVRMILSSGIGTTCHRTYLHAANGTLIGQM